MDGHLSQVLLLVIGDPIPPYGEDDFGPGIGETPYAVCRLE